jgi:hypothetical protein
MMDPRKAGDHSDGFTLSGPVYFTNMLEYPPSRSRDALKAKFSLPVGGWDMHLAKLMESLANRATASPVEQALQADAANMQGKSPESQRKIAQSTEGTGDHVTGHQDSGVDSLSGLLSGKEKQLFEESKKDKSEQSIEAIYFGLKGDLLMAHYEYTKKVNKLISLLSEKRDNHGIEIMYNELKAWLDNLKSRVMEETRNIRDKQNSLKREHGPDHPFLAFDPHYVNDLKTEIMDLINDMSHLLIDITQKLKEKEG